MSSIDDVDGETELPKLLGLLVAENRQLQEMELSDGSLVIAEVGLTDRFVIGNAVDVER
jgi:hypothetical protein